MSVGTVVAACLASVSAWAADAPQPAAVRAVATQSPTSPAAGTAKVRLAQADRGRKDPPSDLTGSRTLQTIIVTAQKQSERLQDVPVPVTVINTENLLNNNMLRLQDYSTSVPGLIVAATSYQTSQIVAIRGIVTGQGTPTVGILIDGVPYGSSTAIGGGQGIPDLDPGDIARIEVLRGPQGTLYGENSLGGLIDYITVDPSTTAFSGRVEAGADSVTNGSREGYSARGSVNIPVSDSFALRASAFDRLEPGWIDNPVRGIDGVNEEKAYGGRLAGLWRMSDSVSLKVSGIYQKTQDGSVPTVDVLPGLGPLDQNYSMNTGNSKEVQAYSAILTAALGSATLTSQTGYNVSSFSSQLDDTFFYHTYTQEIFGVGGTVLTGDAKTHKLSEELRLSAPLGSSVNLLAGVFFTKENTGFNADFLAVNPEQQVVGAFVNSTFPSTYREAAGFTDLTWKMTKRLSVQFGGRYTDFRQTEYEDDNGVVYNTLFFHPPRPNPTIISPNPLNDHAFTYLVTPKFQVTPDLMIYATVASGYRAGGVNSTVYPGIPEGYNPDKTQDYSLGVKTDMFHHTFSIDASAYYIQWKDIQLFETAPSGAGYFVNGASAKSQGLELSVQSRPARGLTLGGWVAWNDATLTQQFPAAASVQGVAGERLPYNMRFSGTLSAQERVPLTDDLGGFAGVNMSYVGDRLGEFTAAGQQRSTMPGYEKLDVNAGVEGGAWTVTLYVNNATDKRGILVRGIDAGIDPFAVNYIQPRNIGLSLLKTF